MIGDTMITKHHSHDYGYIFLLVDHFPALPARIEIEGRTFYKRKEFHVSLMALKHLLPLINVGKNNVSEADLVQDFLEYQRSHDLSEFKLNNIFRYAKREERETIICMVDIPNLEGLFGFIRKKYGVNIPTQPTHITLYNAQPEADKNVGILSQAELEKDSKPIDLPNLKLFYL